eukprot:SM000035S13095  [mRNA]  locus=s35:361782:363637:- [translate_table: standard]
MDQRRRRRRRRRRLSVAAAAAKRQRSDKEQEAAAALIPGLPRDIAVACLARVPRGHYLALDFGRPTCHLRTPRRTLILQPLRPSSSGIQLDRHRCRKLHTGAREARGVCRSWRELLQSDEIYVYASELMACSRTSQKVWIYDVTTNHWALGAPMQAGRADFFRVVLKNDIFVGGGHGTEPISRSVESLDCADEESTWRSLPLLLDTLLYLMKQDNATWGSVYNPEAEEWRHGLAFLVESGASASASDTLYIVNRQCVLHTYLRSVKEALCTSHGEVGGKEVSSFSVRPD